MSTLLSAIVSGAEVLSIGSSVSTRASSLRPFLSDGVFCLTWRWSPEWGTIKRPSVCRSLLFAQRKSLPHIERLGSADFASEKAKIAAFCWERKKNRTVRRWCWRYWGTKLIAQGVLSLCGEKWSECPSVFRLKKQTTLMCILWTKRQNNIMAFLLSWWRKRNVKKEKR